MSSKGGFNPRAHAGRDDIPAPCQAGYAAFQSTRPRGARPVTIARDGPIRLVSIHAPTRGATDQSRQADADTRFQSTRPRGARHIANDINTVLNEFQSTRPRGARRGGIPARGGIRAVSIHAPTRGATWRNPRARRNPSCFNPRAHAGRDSSPMISTPCSTSFNPRAHAGRDLKSLSRRNAASCFNPRAHAGRDLLFIVIISLKPKFQSTRPRGARRAKQGAPNSCYSVSIHAPTRGATDGLKVG